MRPFRHLPIKQKLTLLILLTSATTLLLAYLPSVTWEYFRFRQTIVRDLDTQAEIAGANCAAALAFNDREAAQETLSLLAGRKRILAACIYRPNGQEFVEYVRNGVTESLPPAFLAHEGPLFKGGQVTLCRRIYLEGDYVGAISLSADLSDEWIGFGVYAGIGLAVMLALLVLTLVISRRLQGLVSEPILALAQVARSVRFGKDYSLRAPRLAEDEVGALAEDFNQMLEEIGRHHAELRSSEERFRQLAENIRQVFWMRNPATNQLLYVSPGYEAIWGRSCADLYASPTDWLEAIHPEDREAVRNAVPKQQHGQFDQNYRIIRPDKSLRWIHDRAFPVRNEKGEVYRIAGIAEDITERKRIDLALEEKDRRLRSVVDRAPIVVFAIDKKGIIRTEEGHALHDLNIKPGDNVGKHMAELFADRPQIIENINRSLFGDEFTEIEHFGGQIFNTWHAPQRDELGRIIGAVGVAVNVTERFRLEREVLEISDREQSRIGQDLHDGLCQYLVGIAFAANALEERLAEQGIPEVTAAHEIAAMLDEALSQARHTAHGLFPVRLDAEGLAAGLEELASKVSDRHNLGCIFEYPAPVPLSDSTIVIQLYRIAQEAVNNAIKHAHSRRIVIRLTRAYGRLNLSVVDDGDGIPEPLRSSRGMGLHIMTYRADTIGGSLMVRRRREGGTEVICTVAESAPVKPYQTEEGNR